MTESAEVEKNSQVLFSFATKNFIKLGRVVQSPIKLTQD